MSEAKQRTNSYYIKNILIGFGIAVVFTLILAMVFGEQDIRSNANEVPISKLADDQQRKLECEELLQLGDALVRINNNNKNITEWSAEDRIRVLEIEELYQDKCVPTDEEIITDLEKCTTIYITIQSLIDKMEERHLGTLSEVEQEAYNENYKEYYNAYCNRIKDEIEKTSDFIKFNMTRG